MGVRFLESEVPLYIAATFGLHPTEDTLGAYGDGFLEIGLPFDPSFRVVHTVIREEP